ncbi:lob domain-containing protein [Ranunculus cassubicifolius]
MRLRDPVYGCVGVISLLQHQLRQLQMDLSCAKSELSKYQNVGLTGHGLIAAVAAAAASHPHMGISLLTGPDLHHHQFFSRDHHNHQSLRGFDVNGAYDTSLIAGMNVSANIAQFQGQPRTAGGDDRIGPS